MKFRIGQIVVGVNGNFRDCGKGKVVHLPESDVFEGRIGVEWERFKWGHNCDGHCKHGMGYYCKDDEIEPLEDWIEEWR